MVFQEGNEEWKKGKPGRKGFGIENAKKHLLQQSFYIGNKSLEKDNDIDEKEKRTLAFKVIDKELGKNIDIKAEFTIKDYDAEQIKRVAKEIANARTGSEE